MTDLVRVTPLEGEDDYRWLRGLWTSEWGGETMVSKGTTYHLSDLGSLIAWNGPDRAGAATFHCDGQECELLSINATVDNSGVGTALLKAVEHQALNQGAERVWLITSNDNMDALRFYQRRGYRIVAVYPGAIDEARRRKPTIPLVGHYEIPVHDELELAKDLLP